MDYHVIPDIHQPEGGQRSSHYTSISLTSMWMRWIVLVCGVKEERGHSSTWFDHLHTPEDELTDEDGENKTTICACSNAQCVRQ